MGPVVPREQGGSLPHHGREKPASLVLPATYPPLSWPWDPAPLRGNVFSGSSAAGGPGASLNHLDQPSYFHSMFKLPEDTVWKPGWC